MFENPLPAAMLGMFRFESSAAIWVGAVELRWQDHPLMFAFMLAILLVVLSVLRRQLDGGRTTWSGGE